MLKDFKRLILGNSENFILEHRCYNGVNLAAACGCLLSSLINPMLGISHLITITTAVIGTTYLWLYIKSRRNDVYRPVIWLYLFNGATLLIATWLLNGGINGPNTFVSMVALVAMTVVMKTRKLLVIGFVFFPIMSLLFLGEYLFPELVMGYNSVEQRFMDVYLSFVIATFVIFSIVILILQSYKQEKEHLDEARHLLEEKMATLDRTNLDLKEALRKVKTLKGLLPICSACKKIRDDEGYWNKIESYIEKHIDVSFSHSICPNCSDEFYGNEDWYIELKKDDEEDCL